MNFKVGRPYYLKFEDHSVGIKGMMTIEAIGWCIENHSKYAIFTSWQVISEDKSVVDSNHEPFSIVKSCIIKKRVLNFK